MVGTGPDVWEPAAPVHASRGGRQALTHIAVSSEPPSVGASGMGCVPHAGVQVVQWDHADPKLVAGTDSWHLPLCIGI